MFGGGSVWQWHMRSLKFNDQMKVYNGARPRGYAIAVIRRKRVNDPWKF